MRRKHFRSLMLVLAASLAAAPISPAGAATPFPHITSFEANRAIPTRSSLPGHVDLYGTLTRSLEEPCLLTDAALVHVRFPATVDGGLQRAATAGGSVYDRKVSWSIEVLAFGSPHGAQTYLAKVAKAERRCAPTATFTYPGAPGFTPYHLYSKQLSFGKVSHGGWAGYRGVDQLRYAKPAHTERQIWSMLSRGNAVVFLSVTAPATMISGGHEEQWRQLVQNRISTALLTKA